MKPLDILIDVDGVLADIVSGLRRGLEARGIHLPEHADRHLGTSEGLREFPPDVQKAIVDVLSEPGFVIGLPWYPGARDFVFRLQDDGHNVIALTAPYPSLTWVPERYEWLRPILDHGEVIFCPSEHKPRVRGDVLIEDREDISGAWQAAHPEGQAYCIRRPWNVHDMAKDWRTRYVRIYDQILPENEMLADIKSAVSP